MHITPAPRFMHIVAVKPQDRHVGKLIVKEKLGCVLGRVVANQCERPKLAAIPVDAIVFVRDDNLNLIGVSDIGVNFVVFEDAIMSYALEGDLPFKIEKNMNCIKEFGAPQIVGVDGTEGALIGQLAKENYG